MSTTKSIGKKILSINPCIMSFHVALEYTPSVPNFENYFKIITLLKTIRIKLFRILTN